MLLIKQLISWGLQYLLALFILCHVTCFCQSQHPEKANPDSSFVPVHFERIHSVIIEANADTVFDLLGPRGLRLMSNIEVDFLYGTEDELEGALFRILRNNNWIYYAIGEHDTEERIYRSIIFMPESELWINEYHVESLGDGKSKLTVHWRITGYHKNSNEEIQEYVDYDLQNDLFNKSVVKTGKKIENYLND